MAIDSLNKLSNEQMLAMNMSGNGQITNDSNSDTSDETNYAFALTMQNLMDSAKKSNKNTVAAASNNVVKIDNQGIKVDNKTGKIENSDVAKNGDTSNIARTGQTYAAGQKLEDIPMVINNRYINFSGKSGSILSNRSSADMQKIYSAVNSASKKYGVDSNLILAVIKQESDFDSKSTSGAGAAGLMQIMPENFSSLGISDQYDVNQNVDGGTKLLKDYLNQYNGNTEMALMAYNGGPGTMQRRGVSSSDDLYKMPEETQNYVPKVMGYYKSGV